MEGGAYCPKVTTLTVFVAIVLGCQGAHFRGGTISWKPLGGGNVQFYFNLGWTHGRGPGCQQHLLGQFVTGMTTDFWMCQQGCPGSPMVQMSTVNYWCTGANTVEMWEQGKGNFTYKFNSNGPFRVGFEGNAWIALTNGLGNGNWNVYTIVDLNTRSDTGDINSSPVSQSQPIYYLQFGCEHSLKIPINDPDKDSVKCRWSAGKECESICNALPGAYLNETTCTLHFDATALNNYQPKGIYGVAVTIEDYAQIPMAMGGRNMTPSDAISATPLQFLVQMFPPNGACDAIPRFVPPTPAENDVITVVEGDTAVVELVADNGNDTTVVVTKIIASGPVSITQTPVVPVVGRTNTFQSNMTWQTTHADIGDEIICASVENANRRRGTQRCFTIRVVPKGCNPSPCQNGAKCVSNMGNQSCICRPGFSGINCQTDIDDCIPNPCLTGLSCKDGINTFTCIIPPSTTPTTTMPTTTMNTTVIWTGCPEEDNCHCVLTPHHNSRASWWTGLARRTRDWMSVLFGLPFGLLLSLPTFLLCRSRREKRPKYPQSKPRLKGNTGGHID